MSKMPRMPQVLHQPLDDSTTLTGILVGKEVTHLLRCRNSPNQIETYAAEEFGVVRLLGRHHAALLVVCSQAPVNQPGQLLRIGLRSLALACDQASDQQPQLHGPFLESISSVDNVSPHHRNPKRQRGNGTQFLADASGFDATAPHCFFSNLMTTSATTTG